MLLIESLLKQIKHLILSGLLVLILFFGLYLRLSPIALAIPASEDLTDHSTLIDQGGRPLVGRGEERGTNPARESESGFSKIAENVKEKLNLDEPLYPGTKDLIEDAKSNVNETVKSVKGDSGYYDQAS